MSQNKVDYSKGLIYKIVCNDLNVKNVYIGSTTSFRQRKTEHKSCCNKETNKAYNSYVYKFIRDNGGWNNWSMILIDYKPCNTKLELNKIEREHIEKEDSDLLLNTRLPSRTQKELYDINKTDLNEKSKNWYDNNIERHKNLTKKWREDNKEYHKEYYFKNKEDISKKKNEKITCPICNSIVCKGSIARHKKTKNCLSHIV